MLRSKEHFIALFICLAPSQSGCWPLNTTKTQGKMYITSKIMFKSLQKRGKLKWKTSWSSHLNVFKVQGHVKQNLTKNAHCFIVCLVVKIIQCYSPPPPPPANHCDLASRSSKWAWVLYVYHYQHAKFECLSSWNIVQDIYYFHDSE